MAAGGSDRFGDPPIARVALPLMAAGGFDRFADSRLTRVHSSPMAQGRSRSAQPSARPHAVRLPLMAAERSSQLADHA
jgi:hypothetical protein